MLLRDSSGDLYLRDRQLRATALVPDPAEHPWWGPVEGRDTGSLSGDGSVVDRGFRHDGFWRWSRLDGSVRPIPLDTEYAASTPDGSLVAASTIYGAYVRNIATEASGPVALYGGNSWFVNWADLSDGARTIAVRLRDVDWYPRNKVLDLHASTLLEASLAFVPDVSADGQWYTGDARTWELQVRRTDASAEYDVFARRPRTFADETATPEAASLSGDGTVLAYTSAAVDLLPGVRPESAQVYVWRTP